MGTVLVKNADRMMTSAKPLEDGIEFTFADGRKGLLPFTAIPEVVEGDNLASVELPNPYEVRLLIKSGEAVELPWDFVCHYCDASYRPRVEAVGLAGRQAIGAKIRKQRESAGLTQEGLAQAAGIGRVTLVRIENGAQSPGYGTLVSLARAMGRPIGELVGGEEGIVALGGGLDDSQEVQNAMDIGGFTFQPVSPIIAEREASGVVKEFDPAPRYFNVKGLPLNPFGKGPFCKFRLGVRDQQKALDIFGIYAGVYAIVAPNEKVLYVGRSAGRTTTLIKRFNTGYGQISPKNCYDGGQSTNCRVNGRILTLLKEGTSPSVFFHQTLDGGGAIHLESQVLNKIENPPWNLSIPHRIQSEGSQVVSFGGAVPITQPTMPSRGQTYKDGFIEELKRKFREGESRGQQFLDIRAGQLHKEVGGPNRMPILCSAMEELKRDEDEYLDRPPKGKGPNLRIRYRLPR